MKRDIKPATGRQCVPVFLVSGTVPAFTCDCLHFVCAFRRRKVDLCVSSSSRTILALRKKPDFRVAHVILLRPISGNMDVNTLAAKRSELIGNAAIVRKHSVIHNKSTQNRPVCACVFQLPGTKAGTHGRPVASLRKAEKEKWREKAKNREQFTKVAEVANDRPDPYKKGNKRANKM